VVTVAFSSRPFDRRRHAAELDLGGIQRDRLDRLRQRQVDGLAPAKVASFRFGVSASE
jgi:hypothetical protein